MDHVWTYDGKVVLKVKIEIFTKITLPAYHLHCFRAPLVSRTVVRFRINGPKRPMARKGQSPYKFRPEFTYSPPARLSLRAVCAWIISLTNYTLTQCTWGNDWRKPTDWYSRSTGKLVNI